MGEISTPFCSRVNPMRRHGSRMTTENASRFIPPAGDPGVPPGQSHRRQASSGSQDGAPCVTCPSVRLGSW